MTFYETIIRITDIMNFNDFKFHPQVHAGVTAAGYLTPTPIQLQAIPRVMQGGDVIGLAQTGTGKTAVFVLPMLHRLLAGKHSHVRGLIIAPPENWPNRSTSRSSNWARKPASSASLFTVG